MNVDPVELGGLHSDGDANGDVDRLAAPKEVRKEEQSPSFVPSKEASLARGGRSIRPVDFDALVAPLETLAARRLNGPGLEWCVAAFVESRAGFAALVARLVHDAERGDARQPLHVLCRACQRGEHLAAVVPANRESDPGERLRRQAIDRGHAGDVDEPSRNAGDVVPFVRRQAAAS